MSVTSEQFTALAQLLRLRPGPAQDAARLVMVQGMATPDAARQVGMEYPDAHRSVKRVRVGLDLAKIAAGG